MLSSVQFIAMVVVSGTLVACNGSPIPGAPGFQSATAETPASSSFTVSNSQDFQVVLPSAGGGGYQWHLVPGYDTRVVALKDQRTGFLPPNAPAGKFADEIFDLTGLAPGTTTVTFSQYRSWEGPAQAVATRTYPITVH